MVPGGRIEFGEDSLAAVKREIKEELDYDLDYNFLAIQENFINRDNKKIIQYSFCYEAIYNKDIKKEKFACIDDPKQYFYWLNVNELSNYKILPKSILELVKLEKIKHTNEKIDL